MTGIGFYGGFIQIGVSLILMPVLNRVFKMDLLRVNMHKVFVICGYSLVALGYFCLAGRDPLGIRSCPGRRSRYRRIYRRLA